MGLIVLKEPWTRQPPIAHARLNLSLPWAKDVKFLYHAPSNVDLIANREATVTTAQPSPGRDGGGLYTTTGGIYRRYLGASLNPSGYATFIAYGNWTDKGGWACPILSRDTKVNGITWNGVSPFHLGLMWNTSEYSTDTGIYWGEQAGKACLYVGRIRSDRWDLWRYIPEIGLKETYGVAKSLVTNTVTAPTIGVDTASPTTRAMTGVTYYAAVLDGGGISDAAIDDLAQSPWQIFEP